MEKFSLSYLREITRGKALSEIDEHILEYLRTSSLKGARKILASLKKRQEKLERENQRIEKLYELEKEFFSKGMVVAGLDEAGRGPLAGPVVAAAAIISPTYPYYRELKDSKKLSPSKREELYQLLIDTLDDWAIGMASNVEIDKYNILNATRLAMMRAVKGLKKKVDVLLIDSVKLKMDINQMVFTRGEEKSASIAAASILAKVYRDRLMTEKYDKLYPEYNFSHHKGYGTSEHLEKLRYYGPSRIHRLTFAGVLTEDLKDFSKEAFRCIRDMLSSRRISRLEEVLSKWRGYDFTSSERNYIQKLEKKLKAWWSHEEQR